MNVIRFSNAEELDQAAAGLITSLLLLNPQAVLGLATGSTPVGIYRKLVDAYHNGRASFRSATSFNLDEYVGLPRDHAQSYFSFMQEHLFRHIDLLPERIHIPNGTAADLQAECLRYDSLLAQAKQIDLQLLGLGHNGHVGFNEPDHALMSGTHVVELKEQTRAANARFFASSEEVPRYAITMGIASILKAKTILLVVKGEDKAQIVAEALRGPISTACPASLLQTHPNLVVMLDEAAGRELP